MQDLFDELARDWYASCHRCAISGATPSACRRSSSVLGHYDREDLFMDGAPLNLGLFHSGAGFTDDQFYALYGRVAEVLTPFMC